MTGRKSRPRSETEGNFVAEFFGHRVWPFVDDSEEAVKNQSSSLCPFLSGATASPMSCSKSARGFEGSTGVCVVSSDSNDGKRQDWLACPYRTLDATFTLLLASVRTAYGVGCNDKILILPVTVLHLKNKRREVAAALAEGRRVFAFSGTNTGGEVDIPETEVSPGGKVDVSVMEVLSLSDRTGEPVDFGRHMFYEIQTADFHGSPLHAVRKLREMLPTKAGQDYHRALKSNMHVAGENVEGPNKANIFKRTVYQLIMKIQLSEHETCAGFVLILPVPVWDSWIRHLGKPHLAEVNSDEGHYVRLVTPADRDNKVLDPVRAWIFVFDIDRESKESPQPLKLALRVATTSAALIHYTFQEAADQAMAQGVVEKFRDVMKSRVAEGWKGLRPDQKGSQ